MLISFFQMALLASGLSLWIHCLIRWSETYQHLYRTLLLLHNHTAYPCPAPNKKYICKYIKITEKIGKFEFGIIELAKFPKNAFANI
jgi:hypothetical protein